MSAAERFELLAGQWVSHCENVALSSNINDYLDHPAYRELIALGDEAIPLIIERYRDDVFTPWGFLLDDITGLNMIEDRNRFRPADVRQRWLDWWQVKCDSANGAAAGKQLLEPRLGKP